MRFWAGLRPRTWGSRIRNLRGRRKQGFLGKARGAYDLVRLLNCQREYGCDIGLYGPRPGRRGGTACGRLF